MKKVSQDNIKRSLFFILADIFTLVPGVILSDIIGRFMPLSGFTLILMSVIYLAVHGLIMGIFAKMYANRQVYYDDISYASFGMSLLSGELIRMILANTTPQNAMFTLPAFYTYCIFQPSLPEDIFMVDYTENRALFIILQLLFSLIHAGILFFIYNRTVKNRRIKTEAEILAAEERQNQQRRTKSYSKKSSGTAEYIKECLYEGMLLFISVFVVGTVSNVVMLLLGYLFSLPYTANTGSGEYTEENTMLVWLALALIGLAICAFFTALLAGEVGRSGVQFTRSRSKSLKLDIRLMCASILGGMGVYTVLTMIVSLNAMYYLFFASPVQYIARFIGKGERSINIDEAFDFEPWVIAAAVLIYAAVLVVSIAAGYIRGHRKNTKKIIDDEHHRDAVTPDSRDDLYTPPKGSLPRETRTSFTEREMEMWSRLNRRKLVSMWSRLILYIAAVMVLWYLWGKSQGNLFSPSAVMFTILLVLPFYPFKIHEGLFGESYYAEVVKCQIKPREETQGARRVMVKIRDEIQLYLRLRNGTSTILKLDPDGSAEAAYVPGETVYKLSAFRYPVKCSLYPDEQFCPGCGNHFTKKRSVCPRCRLKVTPKEKY